MISEYSDHISQRMNQFKLAHEIGMELQFVGVEIEHGRSSRWSHHEEKNKEYGFENFWLFHKNPNFFDI